MRERLPLVAAFVAAVPTSGACSALISVEEYGSGGQGSGSQQSSTSGDPDGGLPDACPSAPPIGGSVLWSANHEMGDLGQWAMDNSGGEQNYGAASSTIDTDVVHCGTYSVKQVADTTDSPGGTIYASLYRKVPGGTDAYYSIWRYASEVHEEPNGWGIMTFTSDGPNEGPQQYWQLSMPVNLTEMYIALWDAYAQIPHPDQLNPKSFPTGRWVHIEVHYVGSPTEGQITIWQDGTKIYDLTDVPTQAEGGDVEWWLDCSAGTIVPTPAVMYLDDAVISTERLGPGG
jgi:hypothetical protein